MICPNCNTPLDSDAIFCGNCGKQVMPLRAPGATAVEPLIKSNVDSWRANTAGVRAPSMQPPQIPLSPRPIKATPPVGSPPALSMFPDFQSQKADKHTRRNIFIVLLLLLLVGGSTAGFVAIAHGAFSHSGTKTTALPASTATVFFSDSADGHATGALRLTTSGLDAPAPRAYYEAWLVDTRVEKVLPLGALVAQGGTFTLNFSAKINLLGAGNQLEITQEKGVPLLPTGRVVLSAMVPALAFIHVRHLLFSFGATPDRVGLLVGLRTQAQALNRQATLLKSLTKKEPQAARCAAQSIINLVEGVHGQSVKPLQTTCANFNVTAVGDGFGLFDPSETNGGYVILAGEHAVLAAIQTDATNILKRHAANVQIATTNLKKWLTSIDSDARQLVVDPNDTALIQDIVTLSDHVLNGFDRNDNGKIDPTPGEAGAITAYDQGQLMAQLQLTPGGA